MDSKTIVSVKGQIVIPKFIRDKMGLHSGSELMVHLREDRILEFKPVTKTLSHFFGMGARMLKKDHLSKILNVDEAIAEAIMDNSFSKVDVKK